MSLDPVSFFYISSNRTDLLIYSEDLPEIYFLGSMNYGSIPYIRFKNFDEIEENYDNRKYNLYF